MKEIAPAFRGYFIVRLFLTSYEKKIAYFNPARETQRTIVEVLFKTSENISKRLLIYFPLIVYCLMRPSVY